MVSNSMRSSGRRSSRFVSVVGVEAVCSSAKPSAVHRHSEGVSARKGVLYAVEPLYIQGRGTYVVSSIQLQITLYSYRFTVPATAKRGLSPLTAMTPCAERIPLEVDSITVLMLKTRYSDPLGREKTGFSDGGSWGRIYPALCLTPLRLSA